MHSSRTVTVLAAVGAVAALAASAAAQPPRTPLALEPRGSTGEAIWPAYEGWSRNADGSLTLLLGYYNRNDEVVEIPVGEDNRLGPGDADKGQPTHFLPGRNWGVFSIKVPEDRAGERLTWTVRVNNQLSEIAFWANPAYYTDPFLNQANGNAPPTLRIGADGTGDAGAAPRRGGDVLDDRRRAARAVGDGDGPAADHRARAASPGVAAGLRVSLTWKKYRGTGRRDVRGGREGRGASS